MVDFGQVPPLGTMHKYKELSIQFESIKVIEEEAYLFKISRYFCLVYWNWICAIIIHKVKDEYGVLFVKICEVNGGNTHVTCQF